MLPKCHILLCDVQLFKRKVTEKYPNEIAHSCMTNVQNPQSEIETVRI